MTSEQDGVGSVARRRPEQLLLAFFGELVVDKAVGPVPAAVLIDVLAELDVASAATRATLARMVTRGLLSRRPSGRSVAYVLTDVGARVLREARDRVFATDPFAPDGTGWTLVAYSVPESRRDVRHRVRAQLSWAGFGLVRDGLWIAPGAVDLGKVLEGVRTDSSLGPGELELLAFRAEELPGFPVTAAIDGAWRLEEVRARHERFTTAWADVEPDAEAPALRDLTALVADWLDLLRGAPRLPAEHLGPDWPAGRSAATFRRMHRALAPLATAELRARLERSEYSTHP
ncbi:MAG: PadR family transcriptional regulator [Actinomycetota bacterium]|nr:PadR family transcriptional regulator [Actinomycetota bacterium]